MVTLNVHKMDEMFEKYLQLLFWIFLIPLVLIGILFILTANLIIFKDGRWALLFFILYTVVLFAYYIFIYYIKKISKLFLFISLFILYIGTIFVYAEGYSLSFDNNADYFLEQGNETQLEHWDRVYFSVVTITTLGYGDITPKGIFRFLAIFEDITGLIYLGVTFALITHKHNIKY